MTEEKEVNENRDSDVENENAKNTDDQRFVLSSK